MRRWLANIARRLLTRAFPQQLAEIDNLRINFVDRDQFQALHDEVNGLRSLLEDVQKDHRSEIERLNKIMQAVAAREALLQQQVYDLSVALDLWTDDLPQAIKEYRAFGSAEEGLPETAIAALEQAEHLSVYTSCDTISVVVPQQNGLPLGGGLIVPEIVKNYDTNPVSFQVVTTDGTAYETIVQPHDASGRKLIRTLCAAVLPNTNNGADESVRGLTDEHLRQIAQLPTLGAHVAQRLDPGSFPYHAPDSLPATVPARAKRRSVLFTRNCYYNFFYLAEALRKRGWDAVTLSTEPDDSDTTRFGHGSDLRIFDNDDIAQRKNLEQFYRSIPERFGIVHTYGVFGLSILPTPEPSRPWDIVELKRHRVLIGYSHSGCMDGIRQSVFRDWSGGMCDSCVWRDQPHVCSDERNAAWGSLVTNMADIYCSETDPLIDFKAAPSVFRAPLTFAMSETFWHPELDIPSEMAIRRDEGEILIYHAVGNFKMRSRDGENVKGTGRILKAIERLQKEGFPVRLAFFDNIPTKQNRFAQIQCDIIVDQLMYGRYGALAREGMMLGKPVVGRVNKEDAPGIPATQCILETPIVHATTETIYDVLKNLVQNPDLRAEIGAASREHAVKWWSADRLAERFERVYDYLDEHGAVPPESFLEDQ